MSTYVLSDRSTVTVETRATGMLKRLAHDLSIVAKPALDVATLDGKIVATLRFSPGSLRVDGVRKGSTVDRSVLSAGDRQDIEAKMRGEVLGGREVVARLELDPASIPAAGEARVDVRPRVSIAGRERETPVSIAFARDGARIDARTTVSVSMEAFGLAPVKGPLNAFRVDDRIEIRIALAIDVG